MIRNETKASEYRVRTLDRNDLNEKGKIYIGKGGTTTVDGVTGVYDIEAKNIITAINTIWIRVISILLFFFILALLYLAIFLNALLFISQNTSLNKIYSIQYILLYANFFLKSLE